ncbi:MAG: hypothetical protein H7Y33_09055 [Cytophagales bacterium]|nr:hypothetical protein [Rhizobacter sp.]
MNLTKKQGNEHTAKYLILLGNDDQTRAFLFGQDHRFLAEMFDEDDGLALDNLMRAGTLCPPPSGLTAHPLACIPTRMQCFALG